MLNIHSCETNHGWTGGESQKPGEQSLQLLYESGWRVHKDGLQAGQCGQLDTLIGTRQCLQQQRQELKGHTHFNNADIWLHASRFWLWNVSVCINDHGQFAVDSPLVAQ